MPLDAESYFRSHIIESLLELILDRILELELHVCLEVRLNHDCKYHQQRHGVRQTLPFARLHAKECIELTEENDAHYHQFW